MAADFRAEPEVEWRTKVAAEDSARQVVGTAVEGAEQDADNFNGIRQTRSQQLGRERVIGILEFTGDILKSTGGGRPRRLVAGVQEHRRRTKGLPWTLETRGQVQPADEHAGVYQGV